MDFTKARGPGHTQKLFEDLGSNALPGIFGSDVELNDLSCPKVQCAESHRCRSVLGYDDFAFSNVFCEPLRCLPS